MGGFYSYTLDRKMGGFYSYTLDRKMGGFYSQPGRFGGSFLCLSEIAPSFIGRPACSLVGITAEPYFFPVHDAKTCGGTEGNFTHSKPQHLMEVSFVLRVVLLLRKQLPVSMCGLQSLYGKLQQPLDRQDYCSLLLPSIIIAQQALYKRLSSTAQYFLLRLWVTTSKDIG
jgi:hypothetical protein